MAEPFGMLLGQVKSILLIAHQKTSNYLSAFCGASVRMAASKHALNKVKAHQFSHISPYAVVRIACNIND
jgi:hypothetical protein